MRGDTAQFVLAPGMRVEIQGDSGVLRHFTSEYGLEHGSSEADTASDPPRLVIRFGRQARDAAQDVGSALIRRRYKTVAWRASISAPDADPLRADIEVRGAPRWFALSLVQGYLVEPLVSVVAAEHGRVLLPAAGIVTAGEALLLMGRSRTGKSSLSARALVSGARLLGDDQVFVEEDGTVRRFPRRLRVYDDLARVAPEAYRRLSVRSRLGLRARQLARVASGGFIRPSLAVPLDELGREASEAKLTRFVLLERRAGVADLVAEPLDTGAAVATSMEVLAEQRRYLATSGAEWAHRLAQLAQAEAAILSAALGGVQRQRILIPADWTAPRAVRALVEAVPIGS
jgi:hypothetical protein